MRRDAERTRRREQLGGEENLAQTILHVNKHVARVVV